ncbi:MAG: porin, partial [Planctomycetota bacterium]
MRKSVLPVLLLGGVAWGQEQEVEGSANQASLEDPNAISLRWNNGLEFETADGRFRGHLGLWIIQDWGFGTQDDEVDDDKGAFVDGSELRAARFYSFGTVYDTIDYRAAYEFESGDAEFLDVYLDFRDAGPTSLRIGHGFEPFGLESITPLHQLNFAERSLPSALTPLRNTGVMAHGNFSEAKVATYGLGVFRSTYRFGNDSETGNVAADDGEYSLSARLTWATEVASSSALHLGASVSHRRSEDDLVRFRAGTES